MDSKITMNQFGTWEDLPKDYKEQLHDQFINPLKDLGFEFKGYGSQTHPPTYTGVHTLIFERVTSESLAHSMIKELMVDDDSQPLSTYQLYLGTLWVFIPYTA